MRNKALLILTPVVMALAGCTQEVSVAPDAGLANRNVTEAVNEVIFPDDNPSVPDGKLVWDKQNCAECHGADGKGVSGKSDFDLTKLTYARGAKPAEQYEFLTYSKEGSNHPALKDKITRRQIWDLVFYTRNLAVPCLTDDEFATLDPVFGANCAVCHGKRGHGDGTLAKPVPGSQILPLEPMPANFHQFNRFYDRTDDTLYDHIANGIKWEGMPNFLGKEDKPKGVKFDEPYIRNLVRYVRNFHSSNKPTNIAESAPAGNGAKSQTEN